MLYGLSGLVLSLATSGQNKMRHRNRLTFLLVLLVTAYLQSLRDRMSKTVSVRQAAGYWGSVSPFPDAVGCC